MRRVHMMDVPRSSRGMRSSSNNNQLAASKLEQHSRKDTTTHPALTTVLESQQHPQRQTELQRPVDDHRTGADVSGGQVQDQAIASEVRADLHRSGSRMKRSTTMSRSQTNLGHRSRSKVADPIPKSETSRSYGSVEKPSPIALLQAVKDYPNSSSSVSSLDAMWDLNDEAIAVSSSGSSSINDDILSDNETSSNVKQRPSVSDMAMNLTVGDSKNLAVATSQLKSERVAKEAFKAQPADTQLDVIALDSQYRFDSEEQNPSQPYNSNNASLLRSQNIGQSSHPSSPKNAEKSLIALEGQVPEQEAVVHSAVFHLDHHEYRKAKKVLRQLPRIHQKGNSDYKAKLYFLLAKAYQGEGHLYKAQDFAQVSFDERKDLHGDIHQLVEESAELLITILIDLGHNSEADSLRKNCGQRLFDDFIETRPGAAEELRAALHTVDQQRPTSQYPVASSQSYPRTTTMSGSPNPNSAIPRAGVIDYAIIPPTSIYDPQRGSGTLSSSTWVNTPESKWLLICTQAWRRPTSLLHLDLCSTTSDKQLFTDLRQTYLELRKVWWQKLSLKVIHSIRFVQFELHPNDLVDVRKVPDMPPESRKDEYLYQPCDLIPPIGENLMTHLFHHPHEANDRAITIKRSPKKRKQRLAVCPHMGTNIGWGIHLVEGWAMTKLWLLALVISSLGGMVFAVTWSVIKHDIQAAFAVAAHFVALSGLGVGTAQAYLN
ncbi:MAG: hypothetical protein Q9204_004856 [Flavoplaca sp. TL-2023a]